MDKRRFLPLTLMLVAGAITCVINLIRQYPVVNQLLVLLIVLLVFYFLGSIVKWTLDYFDRQNEAVLSEEGEVIEKDAEEDGEEKTGTGKAVKAEKMEKKDNSAE